MEQIYQELILNAVQEKKSWKQLLEICKVETSSQKKQLKKVLSSLETLGYLYYNHEKMYQKFPEEYELDTIETTKEGLKLKKHPEISPQEIKSTFVLLPKDIVVIEIKKDPNKNAFVHKIVQRDKETFVSYLLKILENRPLTKSQMKSFAGSFEKRSEVLEWIHELEKEGKIYKDQKEYKFVPEQLITILEQTPTGKYFYNVHGKTKFLRENELNGALPYDQILVKAEGKGIVKVLQRKLDKKVCEVVEVDGVKQLKVLFTNHENLKVRIGSNDMKKLVVGDRLIVSLSPEKNEDVYEGEFIKKIGHIGDPNIELVSILINRGFPVEFDEKVKEQLKTIPSEVRKEDLKDREDFRHLKTFTIDGKHTKDMDDAISIEKLSNGNYLLGVHIAHVSYYVKPGSPLDTEAKRRGTSVYLLNSVNPMIPHQLSNGICSLNPLEDRLTKSILMEIDPQGNIKQYQIYDAVIRSRIKMSYEEVDEFFQEENKVPKYLPYKEELFLMKELSEKLTKKRDTEGNLFFPSMDVDLVLDEDGKISDFKEQENEIPRRIIENFMICANECLDEYCSYLFQGYSIHRVHETLSEEKIKNTIQYLKELKYKIRQSSHGDYRYVIQELLEEYKGKDDVIFLSKMILKSLSRARYATDADLGHYALAKKYYTHFTSPIRRYPDLKIQQLLDGYKQMKKQWIDLDQLCEHCSFMERQADAAEEDALHLEMMRYVENHLDRYYHVYVVGVDNPLSVQTKNKIPGYISMEDFPMPVKYSNTKECFKDENGNVVARLGDELLVRAIGVDPILKKAKFAFVKNLSFDRYYEKVLRLQMPN